MREKNIILILEMLAKDEPKTLVNFDEDILRGKYHLDEILNKIMDNIIFDVTN
ncbi:hypothetical protein HYG86_12075 [Alkalicella caledoniensis]|uniref:Uncharacterized protein n=1 Tax=Alkalicella caledoniensis TaxID=2731377 RepID=A0A7G9W9T7_ALKCA|nr:hypothetical protein [Alkalicella caledoniensis]QNO15449.1 hypothetical protein HYG86_12075 [Alkalicella caledoniensis]